MKYFEMAVAVDHAHGFKPFVRPPRCKLQSYSHFDAAMLDFTQSNLTHTFKHAFDLSTNFHRSYSTPCLSLTTRVEEEFESNNPRIEIISGHKAPMVHALVAEVAIALASGVKPEPVSSGLGGAYFLHSRNGKTIAVVKPADEEPLAFNNPKGFAGRMLGQPGMKRSIRVGETGVRELAAYLLDHGGFAGVPPSALVKICHVTFHVNNTGLITAPPFKITSLQRFVEHDSDAGDLGPSGFSVSSVHRIGILDIRLLNLDRHAGNMLVKNGHEGYAAGAAELIPIDHGLCLPEALDDPYFEWLHWPQASIPFSESEVEYIANLDSFKDAALLRAELPSIRESSIRVFILCTTFLKQATAAGLSLADIGEMMTREFTGGEESLSILENICANIKASLSTRKTTDHGKESGDEVADDMEIFEFEKEYEDGFNQTNDVSPHRTGKPPKMMRFSSEGAMSQLADILLSPTLEEIDKRDFFAPNAALVEDNQKNRPGMLRSMSCVAHNSSHDSSVCVSFGDMKEDEWALFLEVFEQFLPEAFEEKKSMGLLKQRLGNSCEF